MHTKSEKARKKDLSKSEDEKLDDALGDTFPASDPPSMTDPTKRVGIKKPVHKKDEATDA
jgi:hypothetical protein